MALTHNHISILLQARKLDLIGNGKSNSILELGEQNWYGDVEASGLASLIEAFEMSSARKEMLLTELKAAIETPSSYALWDIAKIFYKIVFDCESYQAIDLHGTPTALKLELNEPLSITDRFDVVTNFGTSEHVFNQYQVFKTIHDTTKPSGLMIHALPNQGHYDHGLYNYHPTFFFDLCEANNYQRPIMVYVDATSTPNSLVQLHSREDYVRLAVENKLTQQSGLFAFLQKAAVDSQFKVPQQGYYDNRLSPELSEAWKRLEK